MVINLRKVFHLYIGVYLFSFGFGKRTDLEICSSLSGWMLNAETDSPYMSQQFASDRDCHTNLTEEIPNEDIIHTDDGLLLIVFDQRSMVVTFVKIFPLQLIWAYWSSLVWYISNAPSGRILTLAFSGKGSYGLRYAIPRLTAMGSLLADHLSQETNWIWVFTKSGKTLFEGSAVSRPTAVDASFFVTPMTDPVPSLAFPKDELRRRFCEENEVMGDLCEDDGLKFSSVVPSIVVNYEVLEDIPIIITAGSRLHYFYFTLTKLLRTPGVRKENIIVILGDKQENYVNLIELFDIEYTFINLTGEGNAKLFQYYRQVYKYVSDHFSSSPAAIFLDEDVEVSPDFFSYMNQTVPLLYKDASLYCINSYSTIRSSLLYPEASKVLRAAAQVAWGYAVTLKFVKEALAVWPTDPTMHALFDTWLFETVRNGRECVFAEQTRALHHGVDGINYSIDYETEPFSILLPLVKEFGITITNADRMILPLWKKDLIRDLRKAQVLTGNPCDDDFLPDDAKGVYAFYYKFLGVHTETMPNFFMSGSCLGIWAMSPQGFHNAITTIRPLKDVVIHLVGVPLSTLSNFKPSTVEPWDFSTLDNEEKLYSFQKKDEELHKERTKPFIKRDNINLAVNDIFLNS